jgi:predicted phage-related endonuclease
MSPYGTELELFYRKKTGELAVFQDNPRAEAGRILEPSIAALAGIALNCDVLEFKVYARDAVDKMGSSFDYEITSGKYKGWLLEIKNVDYLIYRDQWEDDEAPDHIEVQCQHQLELTKRPGIIIACLVGGNDLKLIPRERNEKMGRGIRNRIVKFWDDVTLNREPKPNFSRDAEFIISLHQTAGDRLVMLPDGDPIGELLSEYRQTRVDYKAAEDASKALKAEILTLIDDDVNKVKYGNLSLSCGEIASTVVEEYTRSGYRGFTVRETKPKKGK